MKSATLQPPYDEPHFLMQFSIKHGHVTAPKLIILLYVYRKQPHYNLVSLITQSASMDPKDNVIMRLTCNEISCLNHSVYH